MAGYNYSKKRAAEKGSRSLEKTEEAQQVELQEKRAFRRSANAEKHYVVRLEHKGTFYTKFWRSSQIKANPKKFCQEAGVSYSTSKGFKTPQIRAYLRRNQQQPAKHA